MSDLVRKQLYLTKAQDARLKSKASAMNVTEAELVREALDSQLDKLGYPLLSSEKWQEEIAFITKRQQKESSETRRRWKREDLYD